MPILPVILWTDALVFALLGCVAAFVWLTVSREHLRAPWRKVARSTSGMVAATVLACFVAVGLLDCLHYRKALLPEPGKAEQRWSPEVLSALDALAAPLRQRQERTFSAPFAVHGHSKESITRPDGTMAREYPRLKHGGAHLQDPARERGADIAAGASR
ncbi:MAG: ABC transporter permease, partial [Betaproteobacteria bacterium]